MCVFVFEVKLKYGNDAKFRVESFSRLNSYFKFYIGSIVKWHVLFCLVLRFSKINVAYETLSNEEKREEYDLEQSIRKDEYDQVIFGDYVTKDKLKV